MPGEDRSRRGLKSAVIVERVVREQLRAMGCERFDLGIRRDTGEMILREAQGALQIGQAMKWLRHENAKGAHIYIRPAGMHALSLVDDLTSEAIERMKTDGFQPAIVVETSPNNFQAWLNHGRVLEAKPSTRAAKQLAERFGGDPSSADWRHFGRLAGFTNPKPERRLPSGLQPFTRLRSAAGGVYLHAAQFPGEIESKTQLAKLRRMELRKPRSYARQIEKIKPLKMFQADPIYGGDLHRADMAWGIHAASCGLTLGEIKDGLINGRDLGKKRDLKRKLEYVERTAQKAVNGLWSQ